MGCGIYCEIKFYFLGGKKRSDQHAAVWVPDSSATVCMCCKKTQFTIIIRRVSGMKCFLLIEYVLIIDCYFSITVEIVVPLCVVPAHPRSLCYRLAQSRREFAWIVMTRSVQLIISRLVLSIEVKSCRNIIEIMTY